MSTSIDMPWTPIPVTRVSPSRAPIQSLWFAIKLIILILTFIGMAMVVLILIAFFLRSTDIRNRMLRAEANHQFKPVSSVPVQSSSTSHWVSNLISTRPIEVPLHSDFDYMLTDEGSASQRIPEPPRVVSGQRANGTHHTTFTNVCLHIDKSERKTVKFFHLNQDQRTAFDKEYWNKNSVHWQLFHTYLDDEQSRIFPLPGSVHMPGSTFFYTLAVDNIAQFYQEAICHMPAMIDSAYRSNNSISGYDHLFALHLRMMDANGTVPRSWCESQIHMLGDTMQAMHPDRPIHVMDHLLWNKFGRPEHLCFDSLTVYQPSSCQWNSETPPYPSTLKDAHVAHLERVFDEQHLRTEVQCIQNVTVYSRMDATRRRLLNAGEVADYLRSEAIKRSWKLTVHVSDAIVGDIFAQAHTYNSQELHIAPHSASAYNALWLPANAAYFELGNHGSWFKYGAAPYTNVNFHALNDATGYRLAAFNSSFDDHSHVGERSFFVTPEVMAAIVNVTESSPVRFCRLL